jgi:hypothetical protein
MASSKRQFTASEKSAVAHGWAASGLRQGDYAARCDISPRLLRSWVRRYVPARRWETNIRDAITNAVEVLAGVVRAMEAVPPEPVSSARNPPGVAQPVQTPARRLFDFDDPDGAP